ncbi:MAG: hypothetical protein RIQ46_1708, partial [Pseudomonadota bacterium]
MLTHHSLAMLRRRTGLNHDARSLAQGIMVDCLPQKKA